MQQNDINLDELAKHIIAAMFIFCSDVIIIKEIWCFGIVQKCFSKFCAICGIIFFLYVAYNVIKTIEMHVSGKEKDARLLMHHCINALINLKNVNIKDLKEEKGRKRKR